MPIYTPFIRGSTPFKRGWAYHDLSRWFQIVLCPSEAWEITGRTCRSMSMVVKSSKSEGYEGAGSWKMGTTTKTTLVGNHPMSTSTVTQLIWQTQTMKLKNESIWEPGRLTDEMFTYVYSNYSFGCHWWHLQFRVPPIAKTQYSQ